MAAEPSSVRTVNEDAEFAAPFATPDEVWEMFEADVWSTLKITPEEFLAGVHSGKYVNDDHDPGLTYLFMQLRHLPPDKLAN